MVDKAGLIARMDGVSALDPVVEPRSAAIAGVDPTVSKATQRAKHAAVVRAERARGFGHGALNDVLEQLLGIDQFLAKRTLVESTPSSMAHPMAADRHAGGRQRPDALRVEEARNAQPASDHEEARGQPAPAQRRKRKPDVGGVAVVESDPDIALPRDGIERRLEPIGAQPNLRLAWIKTARRLPDAVESEIDVPVADDGL